MPRLSRKPPRCQLRAVKVLSPLSPCSPEWEKAFQPPAANPSQLLHTRHRGRPCNFTRDEVMCSLFASCLISSSPKSTHGRSSQMFSRRNRFLWFMVKGLCLISLSGQQLRSQCFTVLVKSQLIAPPQEQRAWSYNDLSCWNHKFYFHETEWE